MFGWDEDAQVAHFERWVVNRARLDLWRTLSFREQSRTLVRRVSNQAGSLVRLLRRRRKAPASPTAPSAEDITGRDMASLFLWASAGYRAQPYDRPVALLLSDDVLCSVENVARAWKQLAPDLTIHPLKGSHLECITAHVDNLANTMERCLEATPAAREKAVDAITVSGRFHV
ncbi:MAG: hypothetical protein ABIR71_11760 [Chthoniobacterales bacterium]